MHMIKHGLRYVLFFILVVASLTGIFVLIAKIPRSSIKENVQKSAEYLCDGELFGMRIDGVECSKIDRYADSILLGIAYQYDEKQPLESVMRSAYYYTAWQNENNNLYDAVTQEYEANQQYMRYWHGSNVIVRPLLIFFTLKEIYALNGIVLALLIIVLLAVLLRDKAFIPAIGIAAGLIATSVWYVPFSLEYTWTYFLMLLLSIIAWCLARSSHWKLFGFFFLLSGMLTNFMDFLTTETMTLLVPLLLILWLDRKMNHEKSWKCQFQFAGRSALFWIAGYVGMWLTKWLLAATVMKENVWPYVSGHISERLGGNIGIGLGRYLFGALTKNMGCLFPFDYGIVGGIAGAGLLLFIAYIVYVYHKKNVSSKLLLLYAIIGLVPYVRYLVLHNHSYIHFFFTYRAQMGTILAAVLMMDEVIERRWLLRGNARKRRT